MTIRRATDFSKASLRRSTRFISLKSRQKSRSDFAMSSCAFSGVRVDVTMSRTPGKNCNAFGGQSAVTTEASFPRARNTEHRAELEPKASPSGLTWQVITMLRAQSNNCFTRSTSSGSITVLNRLLRSGVYVLILKCNCKVIKFFSNIHLCLL